MATTETTASQLARDARLAAEVRALLEDPNVVALKVERVRKWADRFFAAAVILGLLFTMVTVQQFAALGLPTFSFSWWTAWFLDPMFSLALIAVLVAEVVTARYQVKLGTWVQVSKWFFLVAVLTMNTWIPFVAGIPSHVLLHAGPVVLVFVVAQIAPAVREGLTEAVRRAEKLAHASQVNPGQPVLVPTPSTAPELAAEAPSPVVVVNPPHRPTVELQVPTMPSSGAAPTSGEQASDPKPTRSDEEILDVLSQMIHASGHKPGIGKVKTTFSIGSSRAERLLNSIPSRNGDRPDLEVSR